jgi:AcrR family transcriptional regulator
MRKKPLTTEPGPPVAAERNVEALDERVRRSRAAVLGVTAQLLFERGFGGATVDEISRRSGVAKTTIYRHWPTRTDLLRDACSTLGTPLDAPDTGSFEADVTALVMNLAHLLRSARPRHRLHVQQTSTGLLSAFRDSHPAGFTEGRTAAEYGCRHAGRGPHGAAFLSPLVFPRAAN